MRPAAEIDACRDAHRRLLATVSTIPDHEFGDPSRLPGWSRAHVVTHLARNADSHAFLIEGAALGEVRHQYPSPEARAADIEAGAGQPPRWLRDDLERACAGLEKAWDDLPDDRWDEKVVVTSGGRPAGELVFRRLREVEVHHVDLDTGYSSTDWPDSYVEGELARRLADLPDRTDRRSLVSWLLGRGPAPDLGPW